MADNTSIWQKTSGDFVSEAWFRGSVGSVLGLLVSGGPSNIAGLVVAVVVDAFNSVRIGWARPRVGKKCREVEPRIAKGDAATTIPVEMRSVGVDAAVLHGLPAAIFVRVAPAMLRDCVNVQAPARTVIAGSQIARCCDACVPAVAQTRPPEFFSALRSRVKNGEAAKSGICQIKAFYQCRIVQQMPYVNRVIGRG